MGERKLSWIQKLCETYDNCISEVGKDIDNPEKAHLLPVSHSTQNAQIEVVINGRGEFLRAKILEKNEGRTLIPVTEDSATRSSGIAPHPLCDKLQYIAGDYLDFVDKKNASEFHEKYIDQLKKWCDSEYSNEKVKAIFTYLSKKSLISDLIRYKIIKLDENNKVDKNVKLGLSDQSDAFVRFRVESPGVDESAVWLDKDLYQNYIDYYTSMQKTTDLCYAKGEIIACSEKHPAKVRNTGDKAKLISANDESGFTYRGRFSNKRQVVSIGYETTQKAHNALRWLIEKQGYKNGDQIVVAWGTKNQKIPEVLTDTPSALFGMDENAVVTTEKEFAKRLNAAIAGYGCDLDIASDIIIMALDAATTGRLSITYYKEFDGITFLNRIKKWHTTCIWRHTYKKMADGINYKYITFIGAPSIKDIILAAYGETVSDKLKKSAMERMLPCILDGAKIPYDIINSTSLRASNPTSMERWEWEKCLTIACALVKKYRYDKFKEEWNMALDEKQNDRSYIFGRLLAIAQQIEEYAQYVSGEKRETNAERFMHQFKLHPYKTWGIIVDKLKPYSAKLGGKGTGLTELMTTVTSRIPYNEFTSIKKLEDSYILGYYCQRQIFVEQKNARIEENQKRKLEKQNEGVEEND
jgi:CRISPR-associated protein Csd1